MAFRPGPRLVVTVCDAAGGPVRVPGLAAWLVGIAPRAAVGTLTLVITTDRRIRALNRIWRGLDKATDVLSFPAGDDPGPARHLGDLVISRESRS
jgi:probable rRNA maturation factor